jgi:hypothetical protein
MINFTETVRLTKTKNSREWRFQRPPLDKKKGFLNVMPVGYKKILTGLRGKTTPSIPVF